MWYSHLEMSADTGFSSCRALSCDSTAIARGVSTRPLHEVPQVQLSFPRNLDNMTSGQVDPATPVRADR